jgi:hypothetical protein
MTRRLEFRGAGTPSSRSVAAEISTEPGRRRPVVLPGLGAQADCARSCGPRAGRLHDLKRQAGCPPAHSQDGCAPSCLSNPRNLRHQWLFPKNWLSKTEKSPNNVGWEHRRRGMKCGIIWVI